MGDVVNSKRMGTRNAGSALVCGCVIERLAPRHRRESGSRRPRRPPGGGSRVRCRPRISRLAVTEGAPGARRSSSRPTRRSSGRAIATRDGRLVIELAELPAASASVTGLNLPDWSRRLRSRVTRRRAGGRPLTRLIVSTRQECRARARRRRPRAADRPGAGRHELGASPRSVEPPTEARRSARSQPAARRRAAARSASAAVRSSAGTPDAPGRRAALASGVVAAPARRRDRARRVEVVEDASTRWSGSPATASSPTRPSSSRTPTASSIDLDGVVNQSAREQPRRSTASSLERVRVSQFRQQPEPVSRVVFDLTERDARRRSSATSTGLVVRFGGGARFVAPASPSQTPQALSHAARGRWRRFADASRGATRPGADRRGRGVSASLPRALRSRPKRRPPRPQLPRP